MDQHLALEFGAGMWRQAMGVVFEPAADIYFTIRVPVAARRGQVLNKISYKSRRVVAAAMDHRSHQHPHEMRRQRVVAGF